MDFEKLEADLAAKLCISPTNVAVVGSTLICGKGNDTDFLCLVPTQDWPGLHGFARDIEQTYESPLQSWRREGVNIIAVTDRGFFLAELAIAYGAKAVNDGDYDMRTRDDRIAFHSSVRNVVLARLYEDPFGDIPEVSKTLLDL